MSLEEQDALHDCGCSLSQTESLYEHPISSESPEEDQQKSCIEKDLSNSFKSSVQIGNDMLCDTAEGTGCNTALTSRDSNYLPWNDYFMSLCYLTSARSKDPKTKVGACIVDKDNRVVSIGYNGMPRGIKDEDLPWGKESDHRYETKYAYVCHAEMNAIINDRHSDFKDCRLYVTKFPCSECAKLIVQAGLREVIYDEKKAEPEHEKIPGMRMFYLAGVCCKKFIPSIRQLCLDIVGNEKNVTIIK